MPRSIIANWIYVFLSALLLILSFPKTDFWILTWISLVPLLIALDGKTLGQSFRLAYCCGLVFFLGTLYWFYHVADVAGVFLGILTVISLVLYLALYFGLFGMAVYFFRDRNIFAKWILLSSSWVVLEYIRGHLFSGFDWGSLAHSQYKNLWAIQIADTTGIYGVSFVIVSVNFTLNELLRIFAQRPAAVVRPYGADQEISSQSVSQIKRIGLLTISVLILVLGYGFYRLWQIPTGQTMRIAIIQANIDQSIKWQESEAPSIARKYHAITAIAVQENPELIIWPETSFPGYLWDDQKMFDELSAFVKNDVRIPLLFGSVVSKGQDYYNGALLLSREGNVIQEYDKLHLVPFGEYLPLRKNLPFLSDFVPIGDFTPGDQHTIFELPSSQGSPNHFSVLICFEDTVAGLSRKFVKEGSGLLINITNDAWFKDTKEPYMHLASAIFRTVENRRGLIRAANTGISGFIDSRGRIVNAVQNDRGKRTYVDGFAVQDVVLTLESSIYTKLGDIFTILCFVCILWGILKRK